MSTTRETISAFLQSPEWSEAEKAVIRWQFRMEGDFMKALWGAICRADEHNLERLSRGFLMEVNGYLMWTRGDLAGRLRKAGLSI